MVKLLCSQEIRKVFITGISPLSLSGVGSAFNVARNLSFHQDLAGLCGLTSSDLQAVLKVIGQDQKHLSEMTKSVKLWRGVGVVRSRMSTRLIFYLGC